MEGVEEDCQLPMLFWDECKKAFNIINDVKYVQSDGWIGYEVITCGQTISLCIGDYQLCCEEYGAECEQCDQLAQFIGAGVLEVRWTYDKDLPRSDSSAGVEISTNRGLLRLWVWNEHNGYYPHQVQARWLGNEETTDIWQHEHLSRNASVGHLHDLQLSKVPTCRFTSFKH